MADYLVNSYEVKIYDSYKVRHKDFDKELDRIQANHPDIPLWKSRSRWALKCEWGVHNFLYKMKYEMGRTKDVDFEFEQKKSLTALFVILGTPLIIF